MSRVLELAEIKEEIFDHPLAVQLENWNPITDGNVPSANVQQQQSTVSPDHRVASIRVDFVTTLKTVQPTIGLSINQDHNYFDVQAETKLGDKLTESCGTNQMTQSV